MYALREIRSVGLYPAWFDTVLRDSVSRSSTSYSADLGKAMLSINAVKGFEYGSGFAGTRLRGSQHNDAFAHDDAGQSVTLFQSFRRYTGRHVPRMAWIFCFDVAFEPVATIIQDQHSVNKAGEDITYPAQAVMTHVSYRARCLS
jgi:chorismate synthase